MADVNVSIGMVSITGYLLVNVRTAANPSVIEFSQSFAGPQPPIRNLVFTGLSPEPSFFDFRESSDGVSLGVLLSTYEVDVANNRVIFEKRFYTGGGPASVDPVAAQNQLIDPYLDGKNIVGVFKEGYRFLKTPSEYTVIAGGGIQLENGFVYGDGETWSVDIDYSQQFSDPVSSNPMLKVTEVNTSLTMNAVQKNGRVRCKGSSTRLVITLPLVSTLLDGDFFNLTTHNGSQLQTKLICQSSDVIIFSGAEVQEVSLGVGEFAWVEKRGVKYEIIIFHPGIQMVGERFSGTSISHPNTMPEDGRLLDGDDYPRLYKWITTQPAEVVLNTTESILTNGSFVPTAGREGCFFRSNSSKKFRLPNTQGWSEKGIKNFTSYNSDASRPYDYPGGTQAELVGPHNHPADEIQTSGATDPNRKFAKRKEGGPGGGFGLNTAGGGFEYANPVTGKNLDGAGVISSENRVKNSGVIFLRRI